MPGIKIIRLFIIVVFLLSDTPLFAQKQNINIVYIGDSITQGVQLDNPSTEAPPAIASAWLSKQKTFDKIEFSNQGISGFSTVDFLPSTNSAFNSVEKAVNGFKDKKATLIFSILLGTNDSAVEGPNGAPVSPEQYLGNLKAIMDRLLIDYPRSKIIIQRPIWYSPNTYNGSKYLQEGLTRLQSYVPEVDRIVAAYGKTNPNHIFEADGSAFIYFKSNYLTDLKPEPGRQGIFYLHPNKKGAEALGIFWAQALWKMLGNGK